MPSIASTTFQVEDIEVASKTLPESDYTSILNRTITTKVISHNKSNHPLVHYGTHSFLQGLYQAYADHRPFVLSPDIIWLLISQGFAQHVNANSEILRHLFVQHQGKKELVVRNDYLHADNPNSPWEDVFPEFAEQIGQYVSEDLIDTLSSNFSTTSPTSLIASQITIMEAVKSYFEYTVLTVGCGIPSITLEGTTEDWKNIKRKLKKLSNYQLAWWTDRLEPIIDEFILASMGTINKLFWMDIFRFHRPDFYGVNEQIDGWIKSFFPYDKHGVASDFSPILIDDMPDELVYVDFIWVIRNRPDAGTYPMQFVAGFTGLSQNHQTMALRPEIGWAVAEASKEQQQHHRIPEEADVVSFSHITEVPPAVFKCKCISLDLHFQNQINIPLQLTKVDIYFLTLSGKISPKGIRRILRLFPNTEVTINKKTYEPRYTWWSRSSTMIWRKIYRLWPF